MKNPLKIQSVKYLLLAVLISYPILIFLLPPLIAFTGIFGMLLLFLSIKEWKLKKIIFFVLGTIISFGLFLSLTIFTIGIPLSFYLDFQNVLTVLTLNYAILYGIFMHKLDKYIIGEIKKFLIIALLSFSLISFFYGNFAENCIIENQAEKGVAVEIAKCKKFNMYNPELVGTSNNLPIISPFTEGPSFVSAILAINLIIVRFRKKF